MFSIRPTELYAIIWSTYVVGSVIVGMRVYVGYTRKNITKVDTAGWIILCSQLGQTIFVCLSTWITFLYVKNPAKIGYTTTYAALMIASLLIVINKFLVKAGFVSMYYQNFFRAIRGKHWIRWLLYFITIYCIVSFLGEIFLTAFICFHHGSETRNCIPLFHESAALSFTVLDITSELLLLLFPLTLLSTLSFRAADRASYIFIALLGLVSILAGLAKFHVWNAARDAFSGDWDQQQKDVILGFIMWCTVGTVAATVAACLPGYRAWWSEIVERRVRRAKMEGDFKRVGSTVQMQN